MVDVAQTALRKKPAPLASGAKTLEFMPKALERVAKFQRMHDPAARISRMGENGDAQGSAHAKTSTLAQPISGSRAKSQIVSTAAPSTTLTQ